MGRSRSGWLDLLLPPACAGCGTPSAADLCRRCRGALSWIPSGVCSACQESAPRPGSGRCARCAARPGVLEACLAACWFEDVAASWIRDYKYATGRSALSGIDRARVCALARELAARVPAEAPDAVVPVPLHPTRLCGRGFNPAGAVARSLAREREVRCAPGVLERVRETRSQTGLDRRARARNVRGAFLAPGPVPDHLWLVDDVVTTGATLQAAARALRRAGARRVVALCIARTPAGRGDGVSGASPPFRR